MQQNDSKNTNKGITHNLAHSLMEKLQLLTASQLVQAEIILDAMIAFNGGDPTDERTTQYTIISILRADVPPLGETYDNATLHVLPTGELVTIDVEFYRDTKTRVILTHKQAKALRAALDDAIGKTAYTILQRQHDAMGAK